MSVEGISSSQNFYQPSVQKNGKQFRQNFQDLAQALDSGDLADAQSAFAAIQQLQTGNQGKGGSQDSPIKTDMAALDKALQSGDVNKAQDAFKKLQQDMQAMHKTHHHHGSQGNAIPAPDDSDASTTAANSTTDPDADPSTIAGSLVNVSA